MSEIIANNKWEKIINGKEYGYATVKIVANAELVKLEGNSYPYFSLTGSIKSLDKRLRDPIITCGAIHSEILLHFPELAPLVKVHLSAPDGVPMHAEANARYWAGLTKYTPDSYDNIALVEDSNGITWAPYALARHLQCDIELAHQIRQVMAEGLPWDQITSQAGLIELWSSQAGKARALLIDTEQASA
jgi:hypothetical protein